jgi:hypothetical protein
VLGLKAEIDLVFCSFTFGYARSKHGLYFLVSIFFVDDRSKRVYRYTNEDPMKLPKMYRIRQRFDDTRVKDIQEMVRAELSRISWSAIRPGDRVAITAGSRGIADIAEILGVIVEFLKSLGVDPFLFPAMGSHGGATAAGQVAMLEQLGVTEASVEAPIISSMEVAEIGTTENNVSVFMDKTALTADHIVVVNRIKSHTKFKAPIESGLMKMMAIGMGKQKGAELYHKAAVQDTFFKIITEHHREESRSAGSFPPPGTG